MACFPSRPQRTRAPLRLALEVDPDPVNTKPAQASVRLFLFRLKSQKEEKKVAVLRSVNTTSFLRHVEDF